jgi:hypothetical protein
MYDCQRCGTSFSPMRIASPEACPRCLAREGMRVPLTYSLFAEVPDPSRAAQAAGPGDFEPSQDAGLSGEAPTAAA